MEQARVRAEIAYRSSEAGKLLEEARAEEAGGWERAAHAYMRAALSALEGHLRVPSTEKVGE